MKHDLHMSQRHRNRDHFAIGSDTHHRQHIERVLINQPLERPVMLVTGRMAVQAVIASLAVLVLIALFLAVGA